MKYLKIQLDTFNLHMIKTDKFKTINMEIMFSNVIKKEDITKNNFLASILTYTTKKYSTKIEYAKKLEELYAAKIFPSSYRMGRFHNIDFNISILNDKYSEKGVFSDTIDLLREIIFNPNVNNNQFDEVSFNVVKNDELSQIERLKEDPRRYSLLKMYELIMPNAEYSYNMDGYKEDLEKITRENLYEYYKEFIKKSAIDVFVIGDIDFKETENLFKSKFNFKGNKNIQEDPRVKEKKHNKKVLEAFEKDNTNQAKLSIACTIENMTEYEQKYVLNIYNLILGGTADSKFFKNIREKHSICYYVSSNGNKLDNLLIISSGINKDNYGKMISLIKKEMNEIKKGNFTEEDLEKAKKYNISILEEVEDKPNQIIASYYAIDKLNADDLDERIKVIKKITKEEIIELSNKIFMDTIFLLGGDKK